MNKKHHSLSIHYFLSHEGFRQQQTWFSLLAFLPLGLFKKFCTTLFVETVDLSNRNPTWSLFKRLFAIITNLLKVFPIFITPEAEAESHGAKVQKFNVKPLMVNRGQIENIFVSQTTGFCAVCSHKPLNWYVNMLLLQTSSQHKEKKNMGNT